jgi:hypothetical protein
MAVHNIRVTLSLTDEELFAFTGLAYSHGYRRAEPRKAWSVAEKKEAARHAIAALAMEAASKGS